MTSEDRSLRSVLASLHGLAVAAESSLSEVGPTGQGIRRAGLLTTQLWAAVRGIELTHSPRWIAHDVKEAANFGHPLFIWIFIFAFLLRKLFLAILLAALSAIGEASLKMIQEALLTSRRATAKVLDGAVLVSQVVQMGATATAFREHFGTGFAGCLVLGLSYQDSQDWNIGPEEHEGEHCLEHGWLRWLRQRSLR